MAAPNPLPPEPSTPDLVAEINTRLFAHFGWTGLIVIAVFSGLIYVWRNWEELQKLPGIRSLVNRPKQQPIPRADPAKFSILMARLEHDSNDEQRRLVLQTLSEFTGIQVLALDRQITPKAADAGAAERLGHAQARGFLIEAQAQVVLWGTVLKQGERSLPKLYWTAAPTTRLRKNSDRYPANHHDLRLPELFWKDLTAVIGAVVLTKASEFEAQRGHYIADRAKPFIDKLRAVLSNPAESGLWPPETRIRIRWILADTLMMYGEQSGNNAALTEAADTYRNLLREYTREGMPLEWAMTQNNLGLALCRLGEHESGTGWLEEAVVSCRAALLVYTRENLPLEWARTQTNLGLALWRLGERENGTARLEEAMAAFRAALLERTRERVPQDWAVTQNNLGIVLSRLGERESATVRLSEAVTAFRFALLECTRERAPLDWAMTQNNLGNALLAIGERENDTARLEEAVAAYREALRERNREHTPLDWASTQNNLGAALQTLGTREKSTVHMKEAVTVYRAALLEYTRERAPLEWARTQNNLANALSSLGEQVMSSAYLDEAVAAYQDALQERTRERVPLEWATTQHNLGTALLALGTQRREPAPMRAALEHFLDALEVFGDATYYIGMAQAGVAAAIEALTSQLDRSDYSECLEQHRERIERLMSN